jgi:hydroxyethylthiazole kinase
MTDASMTNGSPLMTNGLVAPGARLARLRADRPLVQAITNFVAMDLSANALLALGASPAMVHAEEESAQFAGFSNALVVNIGTLSGPWIRSMLAAARAARDVGAPWAFDPVGVGATTFRNETSLALLAMKPTLIRGNASEIMALAGLAGAGGGGGGPKGVDSADTTEAAREAATALARASGAVVAATGDVDFVTDGTRSARVHGGDATMTRVTAVGCALTGVCAAFLAARDDAFEASLAALAFYKLAGSRAGAAAQGPGSFRVAFLDALAGLRVEDEAQLRIAR